ncbi:MAG: hypothetical protein KDK51_02375 [Deltaproteobacteria bacterium]|nr:hypothetical protein [Deltaproteobacteria bacterium]
MKRYKILLLLISFSFLFSCQRNSLVGKWCNTSAPYECLVFNKDGSFDILEKGNISLVKNLDEENNKKSIVKYENIPEVSPKQLYSVVEIGEKIERTPLGIYKIEGKKLIVGQVVTYYNTISMIPIGVSRYEMPKDFTGELVVYIKE